MTPQPRADCDFDAHNSLAHRHHVPVTGTQETQESTERQTWTLLQEFENRRTKHPMNQLNGWKALMFAQAVALVATSMNATSYVLEYGMHRFFPMFLLFNSYVILTLHLIWSGNQSIATGKYSPLSESTGNAGEGQSTYRLPILGLPLRTPWYFYLCLSFLDIVPNYLALMAVDKTSFTSATLLQSLTIPSTMIFCRLLLGKEYRTMHFIGVILCMMGGAITVLTDKGVMSSSDEETLHPHSFGGDILAVLAAVGYGVGDACAEYWSKYVNRQEYLGMLGLFGAFWTLIASFVYERDAVMDIFVSEDGTVLENIGVILWYIISLSGYYIIESLFLMKSDATLLNLSIQTQNFWAILFSVVVFQEKPIGVFYMAITLVVSGVFVYELYGNQSETSADTEESTCDDVATESTPLNGLDNRTWPIGEP